MNGKIIKGFVLTGLVVNCFSSTSNKEWFKLNKNRDVLFNIYRVGVKSDNNSSSTTGIGFMFDSEAFKLKFEKSNEFFKTGAILKVNPFRPDVYFKIGANYLNQKIFSPANTNTRINQYSVAFSAGYMFDNTFYAESGGSYTKLYGKVFGGYEIKSESTSQAYIELAKRWDGTLGTIDTTANTGEIFYQFKENKFSSGIGLDYYPKDNIKLSYLYQFENKNIINYYKAQWSFLFAEYVKNISNNTYTGRVGVSITFDDIFDLSTYKVPSNIKTHLSELHRFEDITLFDNLQLQTSKGVTSNTNHLSIFMKNQTIPECNGQSTTFTLSHPVVSGATKGAVYSLVSAPSVFSINSSNGIITYNGYYITKDKTFTVTVKVTNPDGVSSSATFKVRVKNDPMDCTI